MCTELVRALNYVSNAIANKNPLKEENKKKYEKLSEWHFLTCT